MLNWFARRMKEAREDEQGFTLIELLVVVTIIGILAAIAIPTFLAQREKGWEADAKSNVRNAAAAATSCSSEKGGSYVDCKTADQLKPYGFNKSASVDVNSMTGTATTWTTSMQHANGGKAFTFTTADGQVKETDRAAGG